MMANFAARYKLARSIEEIRLRGYSDATSHAYLVATRVAYSYSALEALERAIEGYEKHRRVPIIDFRLAGMLEHGMLTELLKHISDAAEPRLRAKFNAEIDRTLANLDSGNVRPIVEGFRNAMFHGKFTPNGSGLASSKSRREALNMLAEEILLTADDRFASWLRTQAG